MFKSSPKHVLTTSFSVFRRVSEKGDWYVSAPDRQHYASNPTVQGVPREVRPMQLLKLAIYKIREDQQWRVRGVHRD